MTLEVHRMLSGRSVFLLLLTATACQTPAATAVITQAARSSPLPASTATPSLAPVSPTAAITATLAPAPRMFTEEFDAGAPYWLFMQAAGSQSTFDPEAAAGMLRLGLEAPNQWAYAVYEAPAYSDVRIDAGVEFGAGGRGAAGLICRYDQAVGWYEFNIYADQTYTLLFGQWLAEGIARYAPLVTAQSEQISPTVNEISLVCEGDVLTPYINNVQMRRRQETVHVLAEGRLGVSAAAFEVAPLAIAFDWIRVSEP